MAFALVLALAVSADPPPRAGWDGWCPTLYRGIAPGVCLAGGPGTFETGRLIVYFHGMVEKAQFAAPELTTLATEAVRRRFAVLALSGQPGLCAWELRFTSWLCWPSDLSQLTDIGPQLVRVGEAMILAGGELKRSLGPPLVMGFSNGGFFSTLLLSETKLDARAWAVLHAGRVTGQKFPPTRKKPVLLVMASGDSIQLPSMTALADNLAEAGFRPTVVTRDGDHQVRADDVTRALDFFEAQLHGPAPPSRPERRFTVLPPPSGSSP